MIQFKTNPSDMMSVAKGFEDKTGFPGVIGAVDGTHIEIPGPSENRSSYVNRKGNYTTNYPYLADKYGLKSVNKVTKQLK
jgi:hypothetical protein